MSNKSPHFVFITALFGVAHQLQLGTELMTRLLPEGSVPSLGTVSDGLVALSLWLFVIRVIPIGCRGILAVYDFVENALERLGAWSKIMLVRLMQRVLARLSQDNPQP
jgi:hypothetical protein